jgi:hypothetical protein
MPDLTNVVLEKEDEDRLGFLVTDWDIFTEKIRQGRGSMVCIYFELKEVQGGDSPTDTMDVSEIRRVMLPRQKRLTTSRPAT